MSGSIADALLAERTRCLGLEEGYRHAGEKHLASLSGRAAQAVLHASRALQELETATKSVATKPGS